MWLKHRAKFGELLEKFEQCHLPIIAEGTRLRYELDLKRRIRPYFQNRRLSEITLLDLDVFRSRILKELSPKSVNNCMQLLTLLFNKALQWQMLEAVPSIPKKLKIAESKYGWWEEKEFITRFLREAKKTPFYAAYLLALECGLRLGEIVGLSKQDVDLKRCQLHIHRQWLEAQKCFGPTKGRRQRFIPFDRESDLREALTRAILKSPHREAIFVSRTGNRVHPSKIRAKVFAGLIRKSQVPKIRFHDLRHTFASWFMLEHDNIWTLMRLLGHADIQTTQRYAHLSSRHAKAPSLSWTKAEAEAQK